MSKGFNFIVILSCVLLGLFIQFLSDYLSFNTQEIYKDTFVLLFIFILLNKRITLFIPIITFSAVTFCFVFYYQLFEIGMILRFLLVFLSIFLFTHKKEVKTF